MFSGVKLSMGSFVLLFRDKEPPGVSYKYISTVASKLFNFAPILQI